MSEAHSRPRSRSTPDVTILGAGLIGLALALELQRRDAHVTVLERNAALGQASTAAAGMLAAHDPHNPPALLPLAEHSLALYPAFLRRIAELSGTPVPFQTETTIQYSDAPQPIRLAEHSIDPRQLAAALLTAVRNAGIDLREHQPDSILHSPFAGSVIHAQGAWTATESPAPIIAPRKGQMLRVALPPALCDLRVVHRSEHVYVVPRTVGPQAGTAILGATVEDAGYDTATHAADLQRLRTLAADLLPALADQSSAPQLESWAGLRPTTADQLPLLGRLPGTNRFYASGHYRNGILLAPATADVIADLVEGIPPRINLQPFSVDRFASTS